MSDVPPFTSGEEYTLQSYSLHIFLHSVTISLSGQNILCS